MVGGVKALTLTGESVGLAVGAILHVYLYLYHNNKNAAFTNTILTVGLVCLCFV